MVLYRWLQWQLRWGPKVLQVHHIKSKRNAKNCVIRGKIQIKLHLRSIVCIQYELDSNLWAHVTCNGHRAASLFNEQCLVW